MTRNLTTRLGERRRRPRRIVVAASTAALVAGMLASGTAQATFTLGGTWGAYDDAGNQLNVATRDVFGSDGSSILTGPDGSKSHAWVDGPDGVTDEGPLPSEFFVNGDITCSPEAPRYYYSNDFVTDLCWSRAFSAFASTPGPWGEAFPITAEGLDGTDLVFDHWQISGSPDVDECFTGEVGVPQFYFGPVVVDGPGGEFDPVLSVGYKAFIDHSTGSGFSGFDFTANAIYSPLTPDTSAPIVTIVQPLDCSVVEAGSSLIASFNCVDPGASDPNPSCAGDVANGTSVDTSAPGEHTIAVTGTDADGNMRTRTIHYTVLPASPPETTIVTHPSHPSATGSAAFTFSGSDNLAVAGLECSRDAAAFAPCTSPQSFSVADGSHTFAVRAVDNVGSVDPTPASFAWSVDTVRPEATIVGHPDDPSATSEATFEFEGTDVGLGVVGFECSLALDFPGTPAPCNDIDPVTGAHVVTYTGLTDGRWVFQVNAVDAAGNRDFNPPSGFAWNVDTTNPGDTTDPGIVISSPTATTYVLNQSVAAGYACTDAGGPPTCVGPVANGAQIDTASVGPKSFTVHAEDNAGNTASASVSYAVRAGFAGFQQPVDNSVVNVAKAGKVVPIKWRIVDANGAPVTNWPTATVTATALSCSLGSTPDQIEEYAAGASGLQNLGDGYYQFNWATPKTYANSCKTLHLMLGDGTDHPAQFQFTK